jgi:hypothetical protein
MFHAEHVSRRVVNQGSPNVSCIGARAVYGRNSEDALPV